VVDIRCLSYTHDKDFAKRIKHAHRRHAETESKESVDVGCGAEKGTGEKDTVGVVGGGRGVVGAAATHASGAGGGGGMLLQTTDKTLLGKMLERHRLHGAHAWCPPRGREYPGWEGEEAGGGGLSDSGGSSDGDGDLADHDGDGAHGHGGRPR
jgi:hypothetical protein